MSHVVTNIEIYPTSFFIYHHWKMHEGSFDLFRSAITTYVKSTSLISTINLCLFLHYACLLPYILTNIERSSTFFLICLCWIMQKGSLDHFGSDRNTYVKSTSLISTQDLCLFFLFPYISINIERSSTFFLICHYLIMREGSLYHFRSVRTKM
jgi:uncharacterized membrane protein (GlpM family)